MKAFIARTGVVLVLFLVGSAGSVLAQCTNNNVYWTALNPPSPGTTATTTCIFGGEYVTTNVTAGQTYTFATCGSTFDTQITVFQAGGGTSLAYNDDGCGLQSTVTWTATFTGTVWVLVDQFYCTSNSVCATLTVTWVGTPPSGPSNDPCSGAIPVSCGSVINSTTVGAYADTYPACGFGTASPGVWYAFTGNGDIVTASLCGSAFDTYLTVLSGTCAGLSCVGYNDDFCGLQSQYQFTSVPGVTYYIFVHGFGTSSGSFTLSISCLTPGPPPTNDPCTGAIAVTCGQTVTGNTFGGSADAYPACGTVTNSPGLWYSFAGNGQIVTASLCGSSFDTYITVFSGSCSSLNCLTYNNNYLCGSQSQAIWQSVSGVTYYILVQGAWSTSFGAFSMSVTCAVPPPAGCYSTDPSGCPDIDAQADVALPSCPDPCSDLSLTSNVFETGSSTSYSVCQINYLPPFPYNTGTGFSIGIDDVYTGVINLPFSFCYYGVPYTQCVVGSNGVISFNTAYASGGCPWAFTASCPSNALPLNSIFGVYHDIDPGVCGDARFAVFGAAPCRAFVVSFDEVCYFSCNQLKASHMIVLYETTNVIEVYVEKKPICNDWNGGRALLGIQNSSGTAGVVAPNRQTGVWHAVNEAWRFTPNGAPNYTVTWYEQGAAIGTGTSVTVCPDQPSQTYVVQAVYTNCTGAQVTVSDDVVVSCAMILLPVAWQDVEATCDALHGRVHCRWSTATETNNAYFTVERSRSGEEWEALGLVTGAGTTQIAQQYEWTDNAPLDGPAYYRIRQTDTNGASQVSPVRSVVCASEPAFSIYPNPGNGQFRIQPWESGMSVRVFDVSGREVAFRMNTSGEMDLAGAAEGMYVIEWLDASGRSLGKVPFVVRSDGP